MKADPALNLVLAQSRQHDDPLLIVADEQLAALASPPTETGLRYLSNRADVATALRQHGAGVDLSDFDFSCYAVGHFDRVIYRISKEKAVVHHIINSAARILARGGALTLIGHKKEGLVSYSKNSAAYFGSEAHRIRGAQGYSAVTFTRQNELGQALNDSDYTDLRSTVRGEDGRAFFSKPGIYGWQKVDRGSMLLIDALSHDIDVQTPINKPRILDLGCGYGYLSVMTALSTGGSVVATDNNIAAIAACEKNLEAHGVSGRVIADDCGKTIVETFDLIVCNPPFHQGFDTRHSITEEFLQQAGRRLARSGVAYFVVNQFIGIESKARRIFRRITEVERQDGFKVLRMER